MASVFDRTVCDKIIPVIKAELSKLATRASVSVDDSRPISPSPLDEIPSPSEPELTTVPRYESTGNIPAIYISALGRLFDTRTAAFRSQNQADLVCHIHSGDTHGFGIMATGSGKTVGFALPAIMGLGSRKIILCIIPYVALLQDIAR